MQQPPTQSSDRTTEELRSDAQQIGSKAKQRLHEEVDTRKGQAAGQVRTVSTAIQRAAGELDDGAPAWLKSTFQQGAEQIQRFADALEQKDSRQLLNEVQSFARERPGTFLAACAAIGFAAARVLKAGGENGNAASSFGDDRSEPWGDGQQRSAFGSTQTGSQSGLPGGSSGNDPLILGSASAPGNRIPNQGELA